MILDNVICNLCGVNKLMFLRHISDKSKSEHVLPTFAKTKVGPAAG